MLKCLIICFIKFLQNLFLGFFQNFVVMVVLFVQWCVPDMPSRLRDQIRREAYLTNEIIIAEEARRARDNSSMFDSVEDFKKVIDRVNELHAAEDALKGSTEPVFDDDDDDYTKQNGFSKQVYSKEQIQDAVLVHKPEDLGEISEVTV